MEEYGYDLSIEEMDAVGEQLERAKRRAERHADAFTDDGDHFFRREQNGRNEKA